MNVQPAEFSSEEVRSVLIERGLVGVGARIEPLSGGVSSDVWLVTDSDKRLVAKSPLAKLRTEADWFSGKDRGEVEYLTLRFLGTLTPNNVPEVHAFISEVPLLVMTAAPRSWIDWRQLLLGDSRSVGYGDESNPNRAHQRIIEVAAKLGTVLSCWHASTERPDEVPEQIRQGTRLQELRTEPFHRATAQAIGDAKLRNLLLALAESLETSSTCLVYGDFSPKNVLVGSHGVWLVDAETAHVGNPILDLSFMSAHLIMKAVHLPPLRATLSDAWHEFLAAYRIGISGSEPLEREMIALPQQTGAILAARVLGVSRATYLNSNEAESVLDIGRKLLQGEDVAEAFSDLRK